MRESGGRPDAFNGNVGTGDRSYGLFQINMLGNLGPARLKQYGLANNEALLDPATNARVAYQMSKGGTDFGAWGVGPNAYRSGAGYNTLKFDGWPGGVGGGPKPAPKPVGPKQKASPLPQAQPVFTPQDQKRQRAYDLINQVIRYSTDGEVNLNLAARATGAVSPKGTVEPPTVGRGADKRIPESKDPRINKALAAAHQQVGKPYVFGSGPSTDSFDCSDLVQYAYKQIGVDIPRTTFDQIKIGKPVQWGQFQPGDLIFSNKGGHVVMYVGNGKVIAAPRTGTVVQYQPVSRFKNSFVTARRVL
jgi:cell wall-associated NlpC family hydrolase